MEPKFEFVGTTNSTQYNVKDKTKNNRVFHIKKIYPDGKETYCEYTTNRVNMNTKTYCQKRNDARSVLG